MFWRAKPVSFLEPPDGSRGGGAYGTEAASPCACGGGFSPVNPG
ncbi:hypothetical protein [Citrobacter pasteurii]|nr:hypothetical protein [Citrobacter pasteurii]